jgi:hypothetical protein
VTVNPKINNDGVVAGYDVAVQLVTNGSNVITSRLSDVAAALAAYTLPSGEATKAQYLGIAAGSKCPIRLTVTTDGVITAADASPNQLASGVEPTLTGSLVRFDLGSTAAGLFTFQSTEAHEIMQIFSSGGPATSIQLVNLDDGLGALAGESIDITSVVGTQVQEATGKVVFDPYSQGLSVQAPAGIVQVWFRRQSRLS